MRLVAVERISRQREQGTLHSLYPVPSQSSRIHLFWFLHVPDSCSIWSCPCSNVLLDPGLISKFYAFSYDILHSGLPDQCSSDLDSELKSPISLLVILKQLISSCKSIVQARLEVLGFRPSTNLTRDPSIPFSSHFLLPSSSSRGWPQLTPAPIKLATHLAADPTPWLEGIFGNDNS